MKLKDIIPIPILLITMVIASCSKEESNSTNETDPLNTDAIKSAMANGSWQISYYFDTDMEETSEFTGFVFTFNADGILNATDGNTALSGAWSIEDSDNDTADTMDDYTEFNILFSSPAKFAELSDGWQIISFNSDLIELIDIGDESEGDEYLTFEKI